MQTLRWGILGAAKFARQHMAPAIHAARGAELVALATSSPEKAAPFQAFAPELRIHDSYEALLADAQIDAVYIPLPNHLHVPWSEKALNAGKHVLCEKPIALEAAQIDPLIALREKTGLLAAEAYMIAHHPQWQRIRHLLADGAIGALRHVTGIFTYNNPDTGNIRFDAAKGGGSLPDIGVYTMGSVRLATGQEPLEITHADLDLRDGVDVTARVSARFEGFTAQWLTAMNIHATQSVTFLGTEGRIEVSAPFNPGGYGEAQVTLVQADGAARIERWPALNQYVAQVEAFGEAINSGAPYAWTLEDAKGTQAVIDAVYAKAAAG